MCWEDCEGYILNDCERKVGNETKDRRERNETKNGEGVRGNDTKRQRREREE